MSITKIKREVAQLDKVQRSPKPKVGGSSPSFPATQLPPITEEYIRSKYNLNDHRKITINREHIQLFKLIADHLAEVGVGATDDEDENEEEVTQVTAEQAIEALKQYLVHENSKNLFAKVLVYRSSDFWSSMDKPRVYLTANQLVFVKEEEIRESDDSVIKRLMVQEEDERSLAEYRARREAGLKKKTIQALKKSVRHTLK
jgi:NDP-sugar pyrophosphorylase family protein